MRKTDKKIDKALTKALTELCEDSLENIEGFQWLTHQVNYSNFPSSLKITCVFDTNERVKKLLNSRAESTLISQISTICNHLNITLKNISAHVGFDSEERCDIEHQGNWAQRLQRH